MPPDHSEAIRGAIAFLIFRSRLAASRSQPQEVYTQLRDAIRLVPAFESDGSLFAEVFRTSCADNLLDVLVEVLGSTAPPVEMIPEIEHACLRMGSAECLRQAIRSHRVLALEFQRSGSIPADTDMKVRLHETAYGFVGGRAADLAFQLDAFAELERILNLTGAARVSALRDLKAGIATSTKAWNRAHSRLVVPAFTESADTVHRLHARAECARVALAIERYRARHQDTLPDSLAQLVPDFLSAVPLDPMDDKPLRYRRLERGYTVYSVGLNGTDDHGAPHNAFNAIHTGDVVFTVKR
jgi:hypothetical protein